jgi:hypothetical protein
LRRDWRGVEEAKLQKQNISTNEDKTDKVTRGQGDKEQQRNQSQNNFYHRGHGGTQRRFKTVERVKSKTEWTGY